MNSHLKNFYPDETALNDSVPGESSMTSTSGVGSMANSPLVVDASSADYERKINLLTKKLRAYEKRRHKLVYESKQEQAAATATTATTGTTATATSTTSQQQQQPVTNNQTNAEQQPQVLSETTNKASLLRPIRI